MVFETLGIEEATTVDEFYNNLIAIRDGDPNGNGDTTDEIPLAIHAMGGSAINAIRAAFCWFGRPGTYYVDETGTVIDGRLYEEHKEGIKFFRKLYEENLLDKEIFSLDRATFRAKGVSDPPIYGYLFGYTASYYTNDELGSTLYDIMPILEDQNGNKSFLYSDSSSTGITYQWAITSACEAPEIVVRFCDYLWDPLTSCFTNNGPLGIRYDLADNGKIIGPYNDKDNPDKIPEGYDSFTAFREGNQDHQIPRLSGPLVNDYLYSEVFANERVLTVTNKLNYKAEELWEPYKLQEVPNVTPTAEENETMNIHQVDLDKIYYETVTSWIIGSGDVDAEWDAFVEQMYALGAQEIIDIKQAQTDRYFAALGQ